MTDVFDQAAERADEMLSDALFEQQRRAGLTGQTIQDSAHFCAECDEPISDARRAAYPGVHLCVDCKYQQEKQARRTRGY
ncbi:MAG: TraR/DksA C4-type zinc finger protein [Candidatus Accumulibacter sp.]|uniref:TraR/DksA C4-type zinc finger protein n=1 Tax=Accumulibacter sp. TaxID=2053492 RepID=UPI001AC7A650|nr:TraR/DksA C4-type zinc finger protein [Accumulibacter sp.]MBN8516633.1 TraR/DksA C4-type zinc finger protein [Accumulibacter sp.]MBO3712873.1 TraR/DksA C4-type zinc finger protein [Accumulibacter sp.]